MMMVPPWDRVHVLSGLDKTGQQSSILLRGVRGTGRVPERLLDLAAPRDRANAPAASTLGCRARRARPFDYLLRTPISQSSTRLTFVSLRNPWKLGLLLGC
jgi:hypothetical protein